MVGVFCVYVFDLADIVDWPDVVTPLFRYQELLETTVLQNDEHQTQIIRKLQDLHDRLITYTPPQVSDPLKPSGLVRLRIILSCVTNMIYDADVSSCPVFSTTKYSRRLNYL